MLSGIIRRGLGASYSSFGSFRAAVPRTLSSYPAYFIGTQEKQGDKSSFSQQEQKKGKEEKTAA